MKREKGIVTYAILGLLIALGGATTGLFWFKARYEAEQGKTALLNQQLLTVNDAIEHATKTTDSIITLAEKAGEDYQRVNEQLAEAETEAAQLRQEIFEQAQLAEKRALERPYLAGNADRDWFNGVLNEWASVTHSGGPPSPSPDPIEPVPESPDGVPTADSPDG